MSYRAIKRLVGETSLERKFRLIFGTATLLLITGSFMWYAYRTEHLAYAQTTITGRLLVNPLIVKLHDKLFHPPPANEDEPAPEPAEKTVRLSGRQWEQLRLAMHELSEDNLPEALRQYNYRILKPNAHNLENRPGDTFEQRLLEEFVEDDAKNEDNRRLDAQHVIQYYGAVRASASCLSCHPLTAERETLGELKKGDLLAVVKINMPTAGIEQAVHWNRAELISTALVTALLVMSGSYVIVRYVIVKPVKHLKEVADAISAGELNVRSEIQTGDEFEDLSHAFNRMLRNLVSMQDQWRKVNADLDRKVDELAQANMALYESNRLKGDFLATMSHELRTPLNSILGFSEVLQSSTLGEKQARWVKNIQTSGEQLLNLINDILDLAKIEAGKMEVRLEEFSVRDVCEGLSNLFRPMAEKKNIDLRVQADTDVPLLRQDPGKLQQVLSNLLSNAIKFTPEGGRVLLKAEAAHPWVVLTVTDTGVGIAPEEQELVFEKFRQAGNPLTREHAGTGLGLSIVRELCKLLGGEVLLQSELGRGSTFTVRLPLHLSPATHLEFDLSRERVDLSKAQRVDMAGVRGQESGIRNQESNGAGDAPSEEKPQFLPILPDA